MGSKTERPEPGVRGLAQGELASEVPRVDAGLVPSVVLALLCSLSVDARVILALQIKGQVTDVCANR